MKIQFSDDDKQIARITKALSHPARIYILRKLAKMNSCCYSGDLVDELPIARSTLSQHLKELKYSGLIQGEINPPYIKYCINRENWIIAKRLLQELLDEDQLPEVFCSDDPKEIKTSIK
ncbi:MAG TPA: ArsR family transcriptional regulator [Bacteroidales bacterium]|jgi:DNA-binding transcriptional ArsR family regulator|nr:ArsR family transcriptional regulator [Bacteroidales bacterium]